MQICDLHASAPVLILCCAAWPQDALGHNRRVPPPAEMQRQQDLPEFPVADGEVVRELAALD